MKNLIPLILFLTSSLFFSCKNITLKNSLSNQNIKGKVKEVRTNAYRAIKNYSTSEVERDTLMFTSVSLFDTIGNETEKKSINKVDKIETDFQFNYDDQHHIIKTRTRTNNNKYYTLYNFEYSGNKQIQKKYDINGVLVNTSTFMYDDKGVILEKEEISAKDETDTRIFTYKYDDKGNCIELHNNKPKDRDSTTFYQYDEFGNLNKTFYSKSDFNSSISQQRYYDEYKKQMELNPSALPPPPPPPPPPPAYETPFTSYTSLDKEKNWIKSIEHSGRYYFIIERTIVYIEIP